MKLPILPKEIWDIIFEYKEILEVPIPGKYIICKTINNEYKEQVAVIDYRYKIKTNKFGYEYNYGVYGFHEGFCLRNQIRNLTNEEKNFSINNQFWNLPQEFYQS